MLPAPGSIARRTKIVLPTAAVTGVIVSRVPVVSLPAEPMLTGTYGATRVNVVAGPVNVLPTLSVAVATAMKSPGLSDDQVGRVTLSLQVVLFPSVVAVLRVARWTMPTCHAGGFRAGFQYK